MSFAITRTRSTVGIHAQSVSVEVHLSNGLPKFAIVGLAETAVKESKDRVRSAIINSHFEFPCRCITVNLAPADLPKSGSGFDLPIAIGILIASGQISDKTNLSHELIGELALNGQLRGVPAIIPSVLAARKEQNWLIIADGNAQEAALAGHQNILVARNLREVCQYLSGDYSLDMPPKRPDGVMMDGQLDWSDVKGQQHAKSAMEIAACGGHSVLLCGAPGSGKTMLAKRFQTLLPELHEDDALECAAINSISGRKTDFNQWRVPPFRAPHHTASQAALTGGSNPPRPGEISLAHKGVLFLDELPEFSRHVLETLREPLESGHICISRAGAQTQFPAEFQLIAAMNPCPCGHFGNPFQDCVCAPEKIKRYLTKISGPLLERIDLQVQVKPLSETELISTNEQAEKESERLRVMVKRIQELQFLRQQCLNAQLSPRSAESLCALNEAEHEFIKKVLSKLKLSARAYHRWLKVSRTIADLDECDRVLVKHLQKALSFRQNLTAVKL